ncbi:MAG: hypothetical protein GEU93_04505 [Propionibacteriales bacterium]|nr:hypothetical protein [Propionibacteriales bacterium]
MAHIDVPEGEGSEVDRVWQLRPHLGEVSVQLREVVYGQMTLSVREREAVRMRIAQINDCPV